MSSFDLNHFWKFCAHLSINSKEFGTIKLDKPYGPQRWALNQIAKGLDEGVHDFTHLKCFAPQMRVLTKDLRWVPIGDLKIGAELVAFDEHARGRQARAMRTATVRSVSASQQQSFRVQFADGRELITTAEHRNLVRVRGAVHTDWKPVSWLRPGDVVRTITKPWKSASDYEDGWFGGLLDGEGHLRLKAVSGSGAGISQIDGVVLERAKRYLTDRGYTIGLQPDRREPGDLSKLGAHVVWRLMVQRMDELFRLIGETRPERFIGVPWWEDKCLPGKRVGADWTEVESIERLDRREMIDIQTSTSTFICEGFATHNCRQIGLSTIVLALDLYWPFTHKGMDATVITHDEDAHVSFRTQLGEYYNSLPKAFKPKSPSHNRTEFVFRFNTGQISRLQYQIAGTRASGNNKLGRSKGNAYVHATEMAFWGDQQGYSSLRNALAETNPNRLYVWESTANGYNQFEEQWRIARKATTQRAIFVSWWAHEQYRVDKDSQIFKVYWGSDGKMTQEERRLARDVALLYGDAMQFVNGTKEISPEQIAWFRWYSEEKVADPDMVMQEMPWTEHQAFIVTGAQYFSTKDLTVAHKAIAGEKEPSYFRVEIRQTMVDSQILVVPRKVSNLHVYEGPIEGAQYVLGADPAYGSSDWADRFVISVWRCYADRIEQVAEYCTSDCLPYAFAWIMAYLVGCYAPCAWNLEVNGPGAAVLGEIDQLKKQQFAGSDADRRTLRNFLAGMKEFLWSKSDAISRRPTARGTNSTLNEKNRYMATYRDYFARGMCVPHSRELIEEMKWVVQEPGNAPSASGRKKDDRVIGAALAVQMWHDKLRQDLMRRAITFARTEKEPAKALTVVDRIAARQRMLMGIGR